MPARHAQGRPIHLWDALSGELRGSYRAYNAVDEVTAAYCCGFSSDGSRIFAGYNKMLRVFDVGCPGRAYTEIVTHRRDAPGLQGAPALPSCSSQNALSAELCTTMRPYTQQACRTGNLLSCVMWQPYARAGIVSCLACNPDRSGMLAAGAYSGDAGIFDERTGELQYVLQGQKGGITQVCEPCRLRTLSSPESSQLWNEHRSPKSITVPGARSLPCCASPAHLPRASLFTHSVLGEPKQRRPHGDCALCRCSSRATATSCTQARAAMPTSSAGTCASRPTWCTACSARPRAPTSASTST